MDHRLRKGFATACGLAALLALGACGDNRGTDTDTTAGTSGSSTIEQPRNADTAARSDAQRTGAAEVAQGGGT